MVPTLKSRDGPWICPHWPHAEHSCLCCSPQWVWSTWRKSEALSRRSSLHRTEDPKSTSRLMLRTPPCRAQRASKPTFKPPPSLTVARRPLFTIPALDEGAWENLEEPEPDCSADPRPPTPPGLRGTAGPQKSRRLNAGPPEPAGGATLAATWESLLCEARRYDVNAVPYSEEAKDAIVRVLAFLCANPRFLDTMPAREDQHAHSEQRNNGSAQRPSAKWSPVTGPSVLGKRRRVVANEKDLNLYELDLDSDGWPTDSALAKLRQHANQ